MLHPLIAEGPEQAWAKSALSSFARDLLTITI